MVTNTLHIIIDPSGAQRGSAQTVQAINSIVNATTNLNIQINQTNNNLDRLGNNANRQSKLLNSLSHAWMALKTSMILAIPLKLFDMFIDKMISVDRSYQQFMASMMVSTNSVAKSKDAFEFVTRAARAYGVELETLSKSYAKFRASASTVLPTAAMDRLFLSVTAVASVLHMAPQSVDRMFTAFTQMASKGQIYSEELKQQLGEHLPGAVALAAQAMGVSVRQLMDDMKKGKVDIVKFFSNMPDVIMEKFGKAAELSALSIQSQINNLKSTIFRNFVELNNSGAAMGLSKFIQSIDNVMQPTTEQFKVFGKVVGEAFLKAADFINGLSPKEVENFANQLVEVVTALIQLVVWLSKATVFLVQHGEAIFNLIIAYGALKVAIWGYTIAAGASVAGSGLAAAGVGLLGKTVAVVAAFIVGWQIGKVLREKFLSVELFSIALTKKLHQIVQGFIDVISTMIAVSGASFKTLAEGAINSIASIGASVVNLVPGINIGAPKVNFGASDAWAKAGSSAAKTVGNWNLIGSDYDEMADDAIANKIANADTGRIDQMTQKYGSQIEEIHKLNGEFERLKAEADKQFALMPKEAAKVEDGKKEANKLAKAARATAGYVLEIVDNLKKAYEDQVNMIKNLVESEEITPTQGFQRQLDALRNYTNDARSEMERILSLDHLSLKQKADIQGKYIDLMRNFKVDSRKIEIEMMKERKEFLETILDLEDSIGVIRLSKLEKFAENWNRTNAKLLARAHKEGDQDTIKRLQNAQAYGIASSSYIENESVGYSQNDADRDLKKDEGKLFETDVMKARGSVMGEYENYFKTLSKLRSQDTLSEAQATEAHNNLMKQRSVAVYNAGIAAMQARQDIGIADNFETLTLFLNKIRDGFIDLKTEATTMAIEIGKAITDNIASNLTSVITGAKTLRDAFADIASTILTSVIQAIIQMGVKWAATTLMTSMLGKATAASSVATAGATGAAITTSMAPAAAATTMATAGANTVTASTGMLAFGALMAAMLGGLLAGAFDNGGYIPDGKLGIVGEYGPEIIQGPVAVTGRKTTESIISSATKNNGGGGGTATNINTVNVDVKVSGSGTEVSTSGGSYSEKEIRQMANQMAKIAENVVIKHTKQGGLLDARR